MKQIRPRNRSHHVFKTPVFRFHLFKRLHEFFPLCFRGDSQSDLDGITPICEVMSSGAKLLFDHRQRSSVGIEEVYGYTV